MAKQNDVEQIVADAFSSNYTLDQDGQPNLKISLREAINALLRGTIPTTPVTTLTTAIFDPPTANYYIDGLVSFTDSQQISWIFWNINGNDLDRNINGSIWYKRYDPNTQQWEKDQELSKLENTYNLKLNVLEDQKGNIWLFWQSYRNINDQWNDYIYCQRYVRANNQWENEKNLTDDKKNNYQPVAINDSTGNIWMFWYSNRQVDKQLNQDIYYRRYLLATNTWEVEQRLSTSIENDYYPTATLDFQGNIWVFWSSQRIPNVDIYYKRYIGQQWSSENRLTYDDALDEQPLAFTTSHGETWIFWRSNRTGSTDIWYRRNFGNEIQLNTGTEAVSDYRVIEDSQGDIWIFWQNDTQVYYKHYSGAWGLTKQLTSDSDIISYFTATNSNAGNIWTFRVQDRDIQHQQLIAII